MNPAGSRWPAAPGDDIAACGSTTKAVPTP